MVRGVHKWGEGTRSRAQLSWQAHMLSKSEAKIYSLTLTSIMSLSISLFELPGNRMRPVTSCSQGQGCTMREQHLRGASKCKNQE